MNKGGSKKPDIHGYKRKLDRSIESLKESTKITPEQKQDILDFIEELRDEGLSVPRIHKYVYTIGYYAEWFSKQFMDVTAEDIVKTVREHVDRNESVSDATKYHYKVALRKFFKWLYGRDKPPEMREYPELVQWIRPKSADNEVKLPEQILSEEDIKKLLDVPTHARNKAIVSTLFNGGFRVGELLLIKLKHVEVDKFGASITITESKTKPRRIRLGFASPYLISWLNVHPFKTDPESYLWCPFNNGGIRGRDRTEPLSYQNLRKILSLMARDAGVTKPTSPHQFRHAAATFDVRCGMPWVMLADKYGWSPNSKMPSIYVHLAGQDQENFELDRAGITRGDYKKPGEEIKPVICPQCQFLNQSTINYCGKCGLPLNNIATLELDKFNKQGDLDMNLLFQDSEFQEFALKKLKEITGRERMYSQVPINEVDDRDY